jgi:hypothetical protein
MLSVKEFREKTTQIYSLYMHHDGDDEKDSEFSVEKY